MTTLTVVVVLFGCAVSGVFGWELRAAWQRDNEPLQQALVARKAYRAGERAGFKAGYETGYSAPVRRQLGESEDI